MEVKSDYRQTPIGAFPSDWAFGEIGDLEPFVTSGSRGWAQYYSDRGSAFLRISNLSRRSIYIDLADLKYVSLPANDREGLRTQLNVGDLLISITADIGIIGYIDSAVPIPAFINQHIALLRFDQSKADSRFLAYFLASEGPQRLFRATTDQGAKAGLNLSGVRHLHTVFPALWEQHTIVEVLSDADALIKSLEQLIAKKRQIKQGAMQDLLIGRNRLPGFSGKWEVNSLKDSCWFQEGPGVRDRQFTASGVKLLNGTNIFRGVLNLDSTTRFISENDAYGAYSHFLADPGDIVVASSGIAIERFHDKVALVRRDDVPLCMNTSTIRFKPRPDVLSSDFLYQYLTSSIFKRAIGGEATGSAQLNFGPSHLAKISVILPFIPEQHAIASTLSEMDAEIGALEVKLAKAHHIKQGMMQELLTGRIRLI